jgi:hypothetical protein
MKRRIFETSWAAAVARLAGRSQARLGQDQGRPHLRKSQKMNQSTTTKVSLALFVCLALFGSLVVTSNASAQTTAFTYQGKINNAPANGL